jgi:hypothetical protein
LWTFEELPERLELFTGAVIENSSPIVFGQDPEAPRVHEGVSERYPAPARSFHRVTLTNEPVNRPEADVPLIDGVVCHSVCGGIECPEPLK